MSFSVDNIIIELNIFNIVKKPQNSDDEIVNVDLIEELINYTFLLGPHHYEDRFW